MLSNMISPVSKRTGYILASIRGTATWVPGVNKITLGSINYLGLVLLLGEKFIRKVPYGGLLFPSNSPPPSRVYPTYPLQTND